MTHSPQNKRIRWHNLLPPILLVTSVFIFFGKLMVTDKTLFGSDFVLAFHPWKQFVYDYIRSHGNLPLWNPYVLSGTPFLADIQTSLFYPLGFLFYLLPSAVAYGYTVILHFALGAIFMYAFARAIHMGKTGAFVAAIVFTYNGFAMGHLYAGHLTFIQNYIWIPVVFIFAHKFMHTRKLRYAMWGGLILSIQILGGFPQIAFYTILALFLFSLYVYFDRPNSYESLRWPILCAGCLIVVLFGFSIASIQLFPTYEFSKLSTRAGGVSYEFATMDSLPPSHFLTFFMPNLFGNPVNGTYWKSGEIWKFWELCAYVGIGPLLLVLYMGRCRYAPNIQRFFIFLTL